MRRNALAERDFGKDRVSLLLREFDHRIRNLLTVIELAVGETHSASVEDYRAKLMKPILGLKRLYEEKAHADALYSLPALIDHTVRPFSENASQIAASGPDLPLQPDLALALHLVLHELALNAKKHGAFSSPSGSVHVIWQVRNLPRSGRRLEIFWREQGGPLVKRVRGAGFGLRLIVKALEGLGTVRPVFNTAGITCLLDIGLDASLFARAKAAQAA